MKLFAKARHEPLDAKPWDEARARDTIARIIDSAVRAFDARELWPSHPRDGDRGPHKTVYDGAAGVLAALAMLDAPFDLPRAAEIVHRAWLKEPDVPSLFLGATGVELVRWALTGTGDLEAPIAANVDHPAREIMWGAPGTMLAALHLWKKTGDDRWRALYRASADALSSRWRTQELWGDRHEMLGACHGAAGALLALLSGSPATELVEQATDLLERTALCDEELVNWPADARERRAELVQWCHGAPGIITSLGIVEHGRSPRLDALLEAGGELVWRAGPLRKGPSLCHGTGGNGEAFLTLYRRSGDARWLERARAFAMHAIGQYERAPRPWFSLWTGDLGLALYLRNCLEATPGLPLLGRFIGS